MEPLHGALVVLEPLRPEHAERLCDMRRSRGVSRWWDPGPEGWPLEEDEATSIRIRGSARNLTDKFEDELLMDLVVEPDV
jgi:hypothetical protein